MRELYASSKGIYEAYVNDAYAGDELFTPGFTNYGKLILYQEYDVTDKLKKGKNEILVFESDKTDTFSVEFFAEPDLGKIY